MSTKDTKVIIIREAVWKSWARDLGTFLTFFGLIYIGIFLDSGAMQWVGAILGFIVIACRSLSFFNNQKVSIAEARKLLDDLADQAA